MFFFAVFGGESASQMGVRIDRVLPNRIEHARLYFLLEPNLISISMKQFLMGLFLLVVSTGLACVNTGKPSSTPPFSFEGCIEDDDFFKYYVHEKVLGPNCMGCHTQDGQARDSSMVFLSESHPDHLTKNAALLTDSAGLERNGTSIILLKPLGLENHEGGTVLSDTSEAYAILLEFVRRMEFPPTACETASQENDNVIIRLQSPVETLRSAALDLTGRLPHAHEVVLVRNEGEIGLLKAIAALMEEESFAGRIVEIFGDKLLTDKYLAGSTGIGITDYDRYYDLYWYNSISDSGIRNQVRAHLNRALAREPLELIRHVVANKLPFSEILTADYTMVNRYSARSFGLHYDDLNPIDPGNQEFYPAKLEGIPHAGILTTAAFLNRFPSTPTNRNRHRARVFFDLFLVTDILSFSDRPIDPTAPSTHNPTLNDPQCTLCHDTLDPVAGVFQNWNDSGHFNPPEEGWHPEMAIPGFGGTDLSSEQRPAALQWLAEKTIADSRFALAMIRQVFSYLTGIEIIAPKHLDDPSEKLAAEKLENFLNGEALHFAASNFNLRESITNIIGSAYYRAQSHSGAESSFANYLRSARLLTPEELSRKIDAVVGIPWRNRFDQPDYLTSRYNLFYGGIDFDSVTDRLREPNGVISSVGLRMATQVACNSTARDFIIAPQARRLFPFVEISYEPETADGFPVPAVEQKVKENIQYLHYRLLGEDIPIDHEEINQTYALWFDTWKEGNAGRESGEIPINLPWACQANRDFWTNETLPNDLRLYKDPDYTIRSWMAVMSYLLSDYRFLYQ